MLSESRYVVKVPTRGHVLQYKQHRLLSRHQIDTESVPWLRRRSIADDVSAQEGDPVVSRDFSGHRSILARD